MAQSVALYADARQDLGLVDGVLKPTSPPPATPTEEKPKAVGVALPLQQKEELWSGERGRW